MSAAPVIESADPAADIKLFEEFDAYPWATDAEFQSGLQAVLSSLPAQNAASGSASSPSATEIENRARVFFYERKTGNKIDLAKFQSWKSGSGQGSAAGEAPAETPFPTSYAAIVELILTGRPVPGIVDIPDTVLGQEASSEAKAPQRRKPWESAEASS